MAFVLGEVIAVIKIEMVLWLFLFLVIIKIITKKQAFFVVIFIFLLTGVFVTNIQINQRNQLYSKDGEAISLTGCVDRITKSEYEFKIYLKNVDIGGKKYNRILVTTDGEKSLKIGNKVLIEGTLVQFDSARNNGNFDAKFYYMTQGIYAKVDAEKIIVMSENYDVVGQRMFYIKNKAEQTLNKNCNNSERNKVVNQVVQDKAQVFSAMLLGEKSQLNTELKELYSVSGIAHILAISGLHISIIGMSLYRLLRKKFRFMLSAFVSIIIVILFGLMSGLGITTMRAIIMFVLKLLGEILGRKYDYTTAISLAGLSILIDNPFAILNSGFQMSFAAITGITLVWEKVKQICAIKNIVVEKLICSITVGLVMSPIIAWNYFQLPTYSFLLNLIVVPLMSVVVVSGVLGIAGGFINIGIGKILLLPGCLVLELYEFLCRMINKLPLANIIVGKPSLYTIILYYLILLTSIFILLKVKNNRLGEVNKKKNNIQGQGKIIESKEVEIKRERIFNRRFQLVCSVISTILLLLLYVHAPKGFQVSFLDVGQGDGIFIRSDNGCVITIDGGSTSIDRVGEYRIIPFLKSEGTRVIDYSIVTHTDEDHINGLEEIIGQSHSGGIRIKNLVMPYMESSDADNKKYYSLVEKARRKNINVCYIKKGDGIKVGNIDMKCIYPSEKCSFDDKNNTSTVISLTYGKLSMLFTGDISSETEEELRNGLKPHYSVLKVPHHGSKYSASDEFLSWITPDYSVISVGKNNMYGHPHQDTIERLKASQSKVLRTDEVGGITVQSDGEKIRILIVEM